MTFPSTTSNGTRAIILAAGMGRRFGSDGHKALAPVLDGKSTLQLLLERLDPLVGAEGVTLVTGHRAAEVEAAARTLRPEIRIAHNPDFARSEMLQSLACALAIEEEDRRDAWVLAADTCYAGSALAALFAVPPGLPALAVTKSADGGAQEVEVGLNGGMLRSIGAGGGYQMAHAVRWPAGLSAHVRAGSSKGYRFQWQVLSDLLRDDAAEAPPRILAVELAAGSVADIDSSGDIAACLSCARTD